MNDKLYDTIQKQLSVYKNNKNIENMPKIYCIKCEDELHHSRLIGIDVLRLENTTILDGGVFRMEFGYGSSHDMSSYYMGICDKCTTDLYKRNLITSFKELSAKMNDVL